MELIVVSRKPNEGVSNDVF